MLNANQQIISTDDNYLKEIKEQQDTLYKLKRQVSDQRREYNKLLVADARAENLNEKLLEIAESLNHTKPLDFKKEVVNFGKDEGILCISDIHYGLKVENIWNKYDTNIAKERLVELTCKTREFIKCNKIKKLHVLLLGDLCHGAIHNSARVASEEETVDQLMHITELVAEVVAELSKYVEHTNIYSTYGNHMRTVQNKNDSIHSDNMERIIPWHLTQRFKTNDTISIIEGEYYEFIKLKVCGKNIVATHGDLDKITNMGILINTLFTKLYNETIDYTISGDKHHLESFEGLGIKSVIIPSFCGADQFANDKRLYSTAGQTFMVFDENGEKCTYPLTFSK